ncbi:hypothetical protein B7463_g12672, partial [Scytalidium lignicola]
MKRKYPGSISGRHLRFQSPDSREPQPPIWVYGPEIIPLAHRAKGEGIATACLWLSSFVTAEIVPTAGLSLEAIDRFMNKNTNPIKKADELRRNAKRGRDLNLDQSLDEETKIEVSGHIEMA